MVFLFIITKITNIFSWFLSIIIVLLRYPNEEKEEENTVGQHIIDRRLSDFPKPEVWKIAQLLNLLFPISLSQLIYLTSLKLSVNSSL